MGAGKWHFSDDDPPPLFKTAIMNYTLHIDIDQEGSTTTRACAKWGDAPWEGVEVTLITMYFGDQKGRIENGNLIPAAAEEITKEEFLSLYNQALTIIQNNLDNGKDEGTA